jgi:hypothetical protein
MIISDPQSGVQLPPDDFKKSSCAALCRGGEGYSADESDGFRMNRPAVTIQINGQDGKQKKTEKPGKKP